ncbi:hypothetical protein [Alkalibacillus salilacus]|uniref:Uncharacterized protein n=1 Tax=Alkalibacillus salilacus TaxID=284582 RepID=A0ABT9VEV9_9BACI|nr:hypothetical protein [Alkalibacillus salilacus]MDQ0159488.1 hypothetical protein [Alkalibacillus salilacus]
MYLKKLRSALGQLSEKEINDIAKIARDHLHKQGLIEDSTRAAHVTNFLKKFIEENKTSGKYLEAYFEALEEWEPGFVNKVFFGEKIRSSRTWRNVLIKITNDISSGELEKHKENDIILRELKVLFVTIVESCITDDEEETIQTLRSLNKVLNKH